jgi:hypothetical protein
MSVEGSDQLSGYQAAQNRIAVIQAGVDSVGRTFFLTLEIVE